MPNPPTFAERQQASLQKLGFTHDEIKVLSVAYDAQQGGFSIDIDDSPELAKKLEKLASIRLHDPKNTSSNLSINVDGSNLDLEFLIADRPRTSNWSATEKVRRSKPKSSKSDIPDR